MAEPPRAPGLIPRPVAVLIAVAITVAWLFNFVGPYILPGFERSEIVNTAFMLVAGAVFALGKGRDDPPDDPGTPAKPTPPTPPPQPQPVEPPPDHPDVVFARDLIERLSREYQRKQQ